MKRFTVISFAALGLAACEPEQNTADRTQRQATEKMQGEAVAQVGMPAIVNFSEMRDAKENYELRDKPQATITYVVDLNGKLHKLCDSVGYGLPYGVQYSNPQKIAASQHNVGYAILPQAEPNGLFMPDSADGTWVKCLDPSDKTVKTVYIEPRVIVSPFPLEARQ
jgi:hypothetical protein